MTRARQAAASFEESSHRPSEPPADDIPWYLGTIISCTIINDFVAQGYGCLTLKSHECLHLYGPPLDFFQNDAQPDGHGENHIPSSSSSSSSAGPKVCVGAGTGLGECYLTPTPTTSTPVAYTCFPSEGDTWNSLHGMNWNLPCVNIYKSDTIHPSECRWNGSFRGWDWSTATNSLPNTIPNRLTKRFIRPLRPIPTTRPELLRNRPNRTYKTQNWHRHRYVNRPCP